MLTKVKTNFKSVMKNLKNMYKKVEKGIDGTVKNVGMQGAIHAIKVAPKDTWALVKAIRFENRGINKAWIISDIPKNPKNPGRTVAYNVIIERGRGYWKNRSSPPRAFMQHTMDWIVEEFSSKMYFMIEREFR